jgi:hypothetical protein
MLVGDAVKVMLSDEVDVEVEVPVIVRVVSATSLSESVKTSVQDIVVLTDEGAT